MSKPNAVAMKYSYDFVNRPLVTTGRVTVNLDSHDDTDLARVGHLYRHGRVVEHTVDAGRIIIVADVPRRLLGSSMRVEVATK